MNYIAGILLFASTLLGGFFITNKSENVGATILYPVGGGTGSSTLTGILVGNGRSAVQSLVIGSNLTLTGTTLDATAASGAPFSFTTLGTIGVSTSTLVAFTNGLISNASSTIQTLNTTSLTVPPLTSALLVTNGSGVVAEYAGSTCTNQAVTAISAVGAATCTTLNSSYLDMTAAYSWTGLHTFTTGGLISLASSTMQTLNSTTITASGAISGASITTGLGARELGPSDTFGFSYASSSWKGTTTLYMAPSPGAITAQSVQCDASTFIDVSLYDGTNRADYVRASSTIGTVTYTTNNTFTAGEAIRVDVGTSTAQTSLTSIACRFKYAY